MVLFIDEISMVRFDVMQYVYNTLEAAGSQDSMKIIAIGDFGHQAAVPDDIS